MGLLDKLRSGVDAAVLKKIAIVTMFIDHLTYAFLEVARDGNGTRIMYTFPGGRILDEIGRGIGRFAFPVFCFLLVEGFIYTRSRWKYLIRLLIFAAAAQMPFCLMAFPGSERRHADTIFTLAAGFGVIWCSHSLSRFLPDKYRPVPSAYQTRGNGGDPIMSPEPFPLPKWADHLAVRFAMVLIPGGIVTYGICRLAKWGGFDYSYGGVLCILILFLFYRARDFALTAAWLWLTYYNQSELLAVTGFFMIRCYNGKRGKQNKYFFYLFYPGHLLFLYLVRKAIWGM